MITLKPPAAGSKTAPAGEFFALADVLDNRRWRFRARPFGHYVAENVFTPNFYGRMAAQFQALLDKGVSEVPTSDRFARTIAGYDAYTMSFSPEITGPLAIFMSRPWHDMLAKLLGILPTGDVNGGFHHHEVGSGSGHPHNDLNPGWFTDAPGADGINVTDYALCDYHSGRTYGSGGAPRETVRAAALLFYLNNPAWSPGDGGETGLFLDPNQTVGDPSGAVPPISNSLLLFECTPHSYHAFLGSRRQPRNSLVMWLHRTKAEVESRWGSGAIVNWPENKK